MLGAQVQSLVRELIPCATTKSLPQLKLPHAATKKKISHAATKMDDSTCCKISQIDKYILKKERNSFYSYACICDFHVHVLEKEMATHSSALAWRIPGMGEPGGLPSMGSHRIRHD